MSLAFSEVRADFCNFFKSASYPKLLTFLSFVEINHNLLILNGFFCYQKKEVLFHFSFQF